MENYGELLLAALFQALEIFVGMLASLFVQNPWLFIGLAAIAVLSAAMSRVPRRGAR